ncbi:hypothetical protein Terro_3804 [Terriglobus roseus DSM 18391]|uniref:TonB-dependent transporter Oar-like beta-barrel domain-containing protein n=1 Tax=Terriglobus roseus (strain DSM 18391 / NRRL B-41598 / KBS 63) TaxID=926566 RepID=I3ZL95_TERRK|nr:TonB-dependent receptor [Terriglobus roseus]AFL90013.1 hypothetical protein Terro_3804 [Terriglobus roseus DSM 18391]
MLNSSRPWSALSFRSLRPSVRTVLVVSSLAAAAVSHAQQGTGNIIGVVRDSTGSAVAGATVDIQDTDRNAVIHLTSNGAGFYNSPPLVLGSNYTVSVSKPGFASSTVTGIAVTVGSRVEANLELKVGSAEASITVEASQASLDTTSGTLGVLIGEKSIEDLPLNGRNTIALATLTPGVRITTTVAQGGFANRGTNLSAISINGSPTGSNSYILDGQNNLAATTGEIAINPTVDAIQEFKVQSGIFSAQYGFTLGGVVNLVSRSGTSKFHGTAYEFWRNDILNARNAFATASVSKPVLRYNQFGGSLGGPVYKDRAFAFGNYEEYRFIQGTPQFLSVPTAAQRAGDFSGLRDSTGKPIQLYNPFSTVVTGTIARRTPYANNQITNIDPVAQAYQNAFYPLPNVTPTNAFTNTNNFLFVQRGVSNMRQALGRLDYRVTEKDALLIRFAYFNQFTNGGQSGGTYYPNPIVANRYDNYNIKSAIVGLTHTFSSTLINDLRFSMTRQELPFAAASAGLNIPQQLGLPANVPNFAIPIVGNGLPAANQQIGYRAYTNPQITDTVTKVLGRHALTFGTDLRFNVGANLQRNAPSGNFSFAAALTTDPSGAAAPAGGVNSGNTYATFLSGAVSSATIATNLGQADRAFSTSFFLQDDWQATSRLTFNLGLRYDYQQQPYEQNNGYSNFDPTASSGGFTGATYYAATNDLGRNFLRENYRDFGPRVGFALRLTEDGKTVVRGGFGIYYANTFSSVYTGITNGFATTSTTYNPAGNDTRLAAFQFKNGFPYAPTQPLGAALGPLGFLGQAAAYQPSNAKTPSSQQYTLSLQRELPYSIVVQASYVGNHGVHIVAGNYNMNQLDPKYFSLGRAALTATVANPNAGKIPGSLGSATITRQQSLLPLPAYGTVTVTYPHDGMLIAHYLELTAQRQASKGLTVLFGYTMGKLMSNGVQSALSYINGISGFSTSGYQNVYNRSAEYGLDPSDVSQRGTLSLLYNLPFGRGQKFDTHNGFVNRVVGGFQVNVIGVMQTGTPLTISGANAFTATRPNYVPGASVSVPNQTRNQWFNTAAFQNPSDFTYGNVPRTLPHVRGPGTQNFDLSIFKTTEITERLKFQIRAEAFNVLNHVNYGLPNTTFTAGANPISGVGGGANTSGSFGVITNAADPRSIQLAGKLIF